MLLPSKFRSDQDTMMSTVMIVMTTAIGMMALFGPVQAGTTVTGLRMNLPFGVGAETTTGEGTGMVGITEVITAVGTAGTMEEDIMGADTTAVGTMVEAITVNRVSLC